MPDRHSAPAGLRSGTLISTPLDGGPPVVQDTVQCCHCGAMWVVSPGSGNERGFCSRCHGFVCGRHCAGTCVPLEQWFENLEKGRAEDYYPTVVQITAAPPRD